jgi:hypothetical protein
MKTIWKAVMVPMLSICDLTDRILSSPPADKAMSARATPFTNRNSSSTSRGTMPRTYGPIRIPITR